MSTWYCLDLGDGIAAYTPSGRIQKAFIPLFAAAGFPHDMAVFDRYDLKRNIVTAYFSPTANKIAEMFNATPCEKPSWRDLGLLVGDVRAWKIHFPDMPL